MIIRKHYSNLKLGLLITATLIILGTGCAKDKNGSKPCRGGRYSFTATSEFSSQKEVYNVGDTIFLNSSFPKSLINLISNQTVDYSNSITITGNLAIGLLDSTNNLILDALSKFKIVNFNGITNPIPNSPNGGLNIFYEEEANYNFKIGLVCLAKGIYRFGLTNLGSQGLVGKDCTNAGFNMTVTNNNKNLLLFQFAIGYYPDALAQKTIYCFRVQ
jgi:hypothetical protein